MADIKEVSEKVKGAKNILVALSKNPSVDEVSAGLGLTLMLDKIGKKATAIYSGKTPDVLKFLKPEETFSSDTNALQDFIIALDKDKADHLRYKVDGDFVKVFITPYHEAISENDLEYSYGDFNVDLIIALDVAEEGDLDAALVEYGRIMHDAGVVNITNREGGSFSDTVWSNPEASSVSEMIGELGAELADDAFEKNSATAILTGIVSTTERFANEKTTPETMGVASKLMAAGADQRLIAENIERAEMGKEQVMLEEEPAMEKAEEPVMEEPKVELREEKVEEPKVEEPEVEPVEEKVEEPAKETEPVEEPASEEPKVEEPTEEVKEPQKPVLETPSELLGEMPEEEKPEEATEEKAEEPATEEEPKAEETATEEPKAEEPASEDTEEPEAELPKEEEPVAKEEPKVELPKEEAPAMPTGEETKRKSVNLQPSAEAQEELEKMLQEEPKKNELLEEMNKESEERVAGGLKPDVGLSAVDTDNIDRSQVKDYSEMMAAALGGDGGMPNPAVQVAPAVMNGPEMNHIPEMDYSQVSDKEPEQPPTMNNGMLEATPTETPTGVAQEGMTTVSEEPKEPGTVPAQEGMTEDILPPPPTPPATEGMMPPGVVPEVEPMNAVPTTPVAPAQPISTPSSAEPVTPVIPAMPATEASTPAQVGPTPVDDNPAAFRIPGM